MSDGCAAIVQRDDPHLYTTALFAPEPARSQLMVLYAFDCELSRASRASKESMIPRMRLQWWRDVLTEAREGLPPKAHDVAGPLATLVTSPPLETSAEISGLINAHEAWLDIGLHPEALSNWRVWRFQTLLNAAAAILSGKPVLHPPLGPVLADAFLLRNQERAAAERGTILIPGLKPADVAAIARGDVPDDARKVIRAFSSKTLQDLQLVRKANAEKPAIPALLPALWAERTLRMVARDPAAILGQLDDIDRPFDGLRLVWRALRGRW